MIRRILTPGLLLLMCLCLLWMAGCGSGKGKKTHADETTVSAPADNTTDIPTIKAKANSYVMANKLDEAMAYLLPKLAKLKGKDKAAVLNEIGGVYFLKDDPDNAVANYLAASDLDPDNAQYMINVATTYENIGHRANAVIFAKKIMQLDNATDSDRAVAQQVIDRSSRVEGDH